MTQQAPRRKPRGLHTLHPKVHNIIEENETKHVHVSRINIIKTLYCSKVLHKLSTIPNNGTGDLIVGVEKLILKFKTD